MRLRKPCEHGRYEAHQVYVTREMKERTAKAWRESWNYEDCEGGAFVISDCFYSVIRMWNPELSDYAAIEISHDLFDALTDCDGAL